VSLPTWRPRDFTTATRGAISHGRQGATHNRPGQYSADPFNTTLAAVAKGGAGELALLLRCAMTRNKAPDSVLNGDLSRGAN
jgi:hypothetical protein